MPLKEQVLDVPLTPTSQIGPKTSAPVGEIQRLVNGQVVKFQPAQGGATRIRVDKREAFATLSDTVRSASSGAVIPGALLDNQTLLTEFGDQLLLISNDAPHAYSDKTVSWAKHDFTLPPYSLRQDYVHTSNSLATTPDVGQAEGVYCYTWVTTSAYNLGGGVPKELPGCYFRVQDADGVVLRSDTRINATDTRVKVVSDGAYFWIISEQGDHLGNFTVTLVDRHGATVASSTFSVTYTLGDHWDVAATSFGVLVAQATGTSVQFSKLVYASGVITRTVNVDASISAPRHHLAFLTNDVDGFAYLAAVEQVVPNSNTIHAYRITSGLAQDHHYTVATSVVDEVANLTGYVVPGSTSDLVVAWSTIDPTAPPNTEYLKNAVTMKSAPFASGPTNISTVMSMNLASRAFKLGQAYYAVGFYPSDLAVVSSTEELAHQPTFFLLPLNAPGQRVAGRWEYAAAYCDWQVSGSKYNFALASVVFTFPGAGMRTALSYRAESFTSSRLQVNGDIALRVQTQATTVGVKAWTFGDPGQAVVLADELLLPGPGASSWSGGEFSESNVALAFEQPAITLIPTGGSPPALTPGTYQWVVVGEWTDNNGNRVRSRPSPVAELDVPAGNYASVSGFMQHATNKRDLLISIYRTDMLPDSGGGFVPSTLHYKVTVDAPAGAESPLYNDNQFPTWQFDDAHKFITGNEILYTDKGQLENFPAPPFSRGCVWQERACVIGPDRAIWFSAPRTEGDATWFHPEFRLVVPTDDEPVAIAATTESYLVVTCRKSMWYFPAVALPDQSGANGSFPEAIQLKFNMGCLGLALPTSMGTVFASSANSVWLLPRDLSAPQWLAQPLADTLDGPIQTLAIDSHQRIYATIGGTMGVYDLVSGCWYEWSTPGVPLLLTSYQGTVTFGDGIAVWRQLAGNYVDTKYTAGVPTTAPYNMAVELNSLHFGAVRNFGSLLEIQAIGKTHTASTVTMALAFDDNEDIVESTSWATDPTVPFEYSYGPANQMCSAVAITLTESVAAGQAPGRGFSIELLSLTVGLYGGQNRLPDSRRV